MTRKTFPVVEIFGPTIQGEGPDAGAVCFFVRFAFCDFRCEWCDSKNTWTNEGDTLGEMTAQEIRAKLMELNGNHSLMYVILTGGNPCLQKHVNILLNIMPHARFGVETQGSVYQPWLQDCDLIVVSPKLPSARGYEAYSPTPIPHLKQFVKSIEGTRTSTSPKIAIKIVVFEPVEIIDALWLGIEAMTHSSQRTDLFLQVGTKPEDTTDDILNRQQRLISELHVLLETDRFVRALQTFKTIRILPQLHVLLWGHSKGV